MPVDIQLQFRRTLAIEDQSISSTDPPQQTAEDYDDTLDYAPMTRRRTHNNVYAIMVCHVCNTNGRNKFRASSAILTTMRDR